MFSNGSTAIVTRDAGAPAPNHAHAARPATSPKTSSPTMKRAGLRARDVDTGADCAAAVPVDVGSDTTSTGAMKR